MLKHILLLFIVFAFTSSISACSSTDANPSSNPPKTPTEAQTGQTTEPEKQAETEPEKKPETEPETPAIPENANDKHVAVVYFSATGNTAKVAKLIADETKADLFEIVPVNKYTTEDLNYNNNSCRANQEQNDSSSRPAIAGDLSAVEAYEVVYMGYPIWWGTMPRIIQTFVENYDLSNAKLYTFCTSGGSGIETSIKDLNNNYSDIHVISGKRFNNATADTIHTWIVELNK